MTQTSHATTTRSTVQSSAVNDCPMYLCEASVNSKAASYCSVQYISSFSASTTLHTRSMSCSPLRCILTRAFTVLDSAQPTDT